MSLHPPLRPLAPANSPLAALALSPFGKYTGSVSFLVTGPDNSPIEVSYDASRPVSNHRHFDLEQAEPSEALIAICAKPEWRRAMAQRQFGSYYSEYAKNADHTNGMHMLATASCAARIARTLALPEKLILLAEICGGIHDCGQPPFRHSGESAVKSLVPDWDHDQFLLKLIDQPWLTESLSATGISAEDVKQVLDDEACDVAQELSLLRHIVRLADRMAYLRMDVIGTGMHPDYVSEIIDSSFAFERSLRVQDGTLYSIDRAAAERLLQSRATIYRETSCHAITAMVNALLKRELGCLVQTGAMKLPEFLASDDANVIDKLPRRSRRVLQQGVDLAFPNVIGWRLSDLNRAGLELVQSPAFARKISALLARKHLAPSDFLVAVCQDYSKQLEIPIGSEGTIYTEAPVSVVVPLENRYAFVALTEDLSPSKRRQVEKGIRDCMRAFLKNPLKASLSEAEILGCQDRRLYRGRDADVELLEIAA